MIGMRSAADLPQELREAGRVEHRLRDRELRSRLDLVFEPPQLAPLIGRPRIQRDADVECRRLANWLLADIQAAVEPRHHVGQADRIDVVDGGRVRVIADARRIASDDQQVAHAHRVRAEQIRLHPEQVSIAARVVEDGLHAGLLLDDERRRERAHPRARARTVGNVDEVHAVNAQLAGLIHERPGIVPARRHQLDADDELLSRERVGQPRLLHRRNRFGGGDRRTSG